MSELAGRISEKGALPYVKTASSYNPQHTHFLLIAN